MKKSLIVSVSALLLALTAMAANPTFRLLQRMEEIDSGAGPVVISFSNYIYEDRKLVGSVSEDDLNRDGTTDRRFTAMYAYDKHGHHIASTFESQAITNGMILSRGATSYEYDKDTLVALLSRFDFDADGSVDSISSTTHAYDSRGNLVQTIVETDSDANGTCDTRTTYARTYDARGNLLLEVQERDGDMDGHGDLIITSRYTLDAKGNAARVVTETDLVFPDDVMKQFEIRTATFAKQGRIISSLSEYDDAEGIVYAVTKSSFSYDKHGNLTRILRETDSDVDGIFDESQSTRQVYAHMTGAD